METSKKPDQKKAKGAATREACLLAAMRIFAERGYHRASMDEIAHAAGVTTGALYWHFPGKEDFLIAALRRYNSGMTNEALDMFRPAGRADEMILTYTEANTYFDAQFPWPNGLTMIVMMDLPNLRRPELVQIIQHIVSWNRRFYRLGIEHGQRSGTFRPDCDAAAIADVIATVRTGTFARFAALPGEVDVRNETVNSVRAVLAAIMAPPLKVSDSFGGELTAQKRLGLDLWVKDRLATLGLKDQTDNLSNKHPGKPRRRHHQS
jgi:AcrR family transcriptional regulator